MTGRPTAVVVHLASFAHRWADEHPTDPASVAFLAALDDLRNTAAGLHPDDFT